MSERLQLPQEISASLLSLGNTASVQQDISGASTFYQQAIEMEPSPLIKVQARINQFSLLVNSSQAPDEQLLSDVTTELASLPTIQTTIYAAIHFAQSLIKLENKEYQQASQDTIARLLAKAVQQSRSLGDKRAKAYGLGTLPTIFK